MDLTSCDVPGRARVLGLVMLAGLLAVMPARAQDEAGPDPSGIPKDSIATSLPANGDPSGRRKALAERGVTYVVYYTNDILANVRGGEKRGTIDQGKLEGALTIDLQKAMGLDGLTLFANGFQTHNTGRIRRDYVGGINTIAAIEARPSIRLSELWLERKLLDGQASLRFGQLAADVEFFFSGMSALFLQSDWATITAANLPSGGPAYPLSTPGARFKYEPVPEVSLLFAVFNGDPAGPPRDEFDTRDEQIRNRNGLNFRVRDPALLMSEAQFRRNQGKDDKGLAGTIKLGAWGHLGRFDDQRFANDGTLLADPDGSGDPRKRRGNSGLYAVIEQQLYRPQGGDAESGISAYTRISTSPSDRNLIDFYVDAGLIFAGLIPGRPDDKLGAGFIYSRFSDRVRAFDRDNAFFTGEAGPIRDFEANLELTYLAQIVPGWTVQPVATYVWHPNGDASKDATVVGVRSFWRY